MLLKGRISSRNHFGQLLNGMGLVGTAVEVGTHRGDFAEALLMRWNGKMMYCIDPWECLPGYEQQYKMLHGNGDPLEECRQRMKQFGNRVCLFKTTSMKALDNFDDGSLDFIHIDGDHSLIAVAEDVNEWWHNLKPGGMMAVHDFLCPGEVDGGWGRNIQSVVLPFSQEKVVDVHLIVEEDGLPWTAYIIKN